MQTKLFSGNPSFAYRIYMKIVKTNWLSVVFYLPADGKLGDRCLPKLPLAPSNNSLAEAIGFIDVIWFKHSAATVVAAFEVEHTTSIYSGILRLLDLAQHDAGQSLKGLYLVAPDNREHEDRLQLNRPAFRKISELHIKYLPCGEWIGIEKAWPDSERS